MPRIDPRDKRMFPKLSAAEIDRHLRFGQVQPYRKDQPLFVTGEIAPGMFVLKTGRVRVRRRDPLGISLQSWSKVQVILSRKWASSQAVRPWWMFTRRETWRRFSSRPRICGP